MIRHQPDSPRRGTIAGALALAGALLASAAAMAQTAAPAQPASAAAKAPARQAAPKAPKPVVEQRAMDLLKATSARLAAARSMGFTAIVNEEYPSLYGPPIAYPVRYDVTMQRPDKLKVLQSGAGPASEFYYDGKTIMAYAPDANLVAVADAPPTIEDALRAARDSADIFYPFTDLLVADPYAALTDGVVLAFYIGPSGAVGGVPTEMLAWANKDVFLQIWIGAEDKLPRRLRAFYAADPLQLRHEMELSNWKLDGVMAAEDFTSAKAKAGQPIAFAKPTGPARKGLNPLAARKAAPAASQPAK